MVPRAGRAGRSGFDWLLPGRLGTGGGGARDLGSTCVLGWGRRRWGEGEAARGRAGRRRGRASERGSGEGGEWMDEPRDAGERHLGGARVGEAGGLAGLGHLAAGEESTRVGDAGGGLR